MFLYNLTEESQKKSFYKLALIMCIAEGDTESDGFKDVMSYTEDFHNEPSFFKDKQERDRKAASEKMFQFFIYSMASNEEYEMMSSYYSELGFKLPQGYYNEPLSTESLDSLFNSVTTFDQSGEKTGYYYNYSHFVGEKIQEAISVFEENKEIKKRIMGKIVDLELEMGSKGVVDRLLIVSDEVRESVINELLSEALANIDELGLTIKQKKSIMFELAAIAFADGEISGFEIPTLNSINSALGLDEDFLDESKEIIGQIVAANQEANELINE